MKYIKLFELWDEIERIITTVQHMEEKYLGKSCIIYFGVDLYLIHVTEVLKNEQIKFSYYSYDDKIGLVRYRGSTDISFNLFKPTDVYDTFGEAEKEYLLLLNAKKYNI